MNAVIILCALLATVQAGVVYHQAAVPVVHAAPVVVHQVPVVHQAVAVHHVAPVVHTKVVPAAHSSTFSFRAPKVKLVSPIVVHKTPVVHQVATHPIFLH